MRITVIGTGYLGAVHAACLASLGHDVLAIDSDAEKIKSLAAGQAPFYEPGLNELLARELESGRLRFTTSLTEVADFGDVHFVCVGTPQGDSGAADLTALFAAIGELAPLLHGPCLVVGKSTVPVGTAADLAQRLSALAPAGQDAELAWNPEFLREAMAVRDTLRPDRIVLGVRSDQAEKTLREVYAQQADAGVPFIVTDFATAELVKSAANAFLATKVSFINAMADLCAAAGADVTQLADALGYDERIGRKFLHAGLGYGGGCLPKDLRALIFRAEQLDQGESVRFLREIDAVNQRRRAQTVHATIRLLGGPEDADLTGSVVACLGAAFKPGSDDVRDSPALDVASALHALGASVRVHDPHAIVNAARIHPELDYPASLAETLAGADAVVLATEWPEYRALDPAATARLVRRARILDARNILDPRQWRLAGWEYRGLGRP